MTKVLAWLATLAFALLPAAAGAAPIALKLAFFSSDQSATYVHVVKPFVDAINSAGKGVVEIVVYAEGALGRDVASQPQLVLDGVADIAFAVPGLTPDEFPDTPVVELPGLFNDSREATLVYTRLIALNALRGYDDFVVLGAYVTDAETIHGRLPLNSIDDLKGQRIQVNNPMQSAALEYLGAVPVRMGITQIAEAMSDGTIDAATVAAAAMADFGIKRIATHHYQLRTSGAPLALLMNRKVFEALPQAARDLLTKYSEESAARSIETIDRDEVEAWQQLRADPGRTAVSPSPSDLEQAHTAFQSVISDWLKTAPRNQGLLDMARTELTGLRATE